MTQAHTVSRATCSGEKNGRAGKKCAKHLFIRSHQAQRSFSSQPVLVAGGRTCGPSKSNKMSGTAAQGQPVSHANPSHARPPPAQRSAVATVSQPWALHRHSWQAPARRTAHRPSTLHEPRNQHPTAHSSMARASRDCPRCGALYHSPGCRVSRRAGEMNRSPYRSCSGGARVGE